MCSLKDNTYSPSDKNSLKDNTYSPSDKNSLKDNTYSPSDKPLLVLDLDETLVYTTQLNSTKIEEDIVDNFVAQFDDEIYVIKKRPHLDEFLEEAKKYFKISIWTAGEEEYANTVVSEIFDDIELEFVYSRKNCKIEIDLETKQIKKIRKPISTIMSENKYFNEKNILIVDDNPTIFEDNSGNALCIPSWKGDRNDKMLPTLISIIKEIAKLNDIRKYGDVLLKKSMAKKIESRKIELKKV